MWKKIIERRGIKIMLQTCQEFLISENPQKYEGVENVSELFHSQKKNVKNKNKRQFTELKTWERNFNVQQLSLNEVNICIFRLSVTSYLFL